MNTNNLIFAPGNYVPISEFIRLDGTSAFFEFPIRRDVLETLIGKDEPIKVAICSNECIAYAEVLRVDTNKGLVRIESGKAGIYAIVATGQRNAFPIVTNWNAALNEGRGGHQSGGTDGIGMLRLNEQSGNREVELSTLRDNDPSNPYYYRTEAYALFAGEEDGQFFPTPAYERYIGETYSLVRVTDEAALKLSNETLKLTGYPLIVRPTDVEPEQLVGRPAFQLIHGCIAGRGEHRSMVSYIVPPFWTPAPEKRYPALFSGFYDQNENVFSTVGPPLLNVLGQTLLDTGKGVVGIIWNGGGSFGTRTIQGSVYDNLDDLFRTAIERYAVDGEAIVTVGGSRGGITSLVAAGNPNSAVYLVRYAICYNVPLSFGEPLKEMANPTCPVFWRVICEDTGYKDAWQPGWTDPEGRSAVDLFLLTLLGTSDSSLIASELSAASERIIRSLKAKGTQVWLTHGTHDAFTSSWLAYEWVGRARRNGVQVRHEIGYRFGHNNCTNPFDSAKTCLESLLTGEPIVLEGTRHYRRASEDPDKWELAERFLPLRQPVFLEGPKVAVKGLPILVILYGEPGMEYRLTLLPLSGSKPKVDLLEGKMESLEGYDETFSFVKSVQLVPGELAPGEYVYELQFRRPGTACWEKAVMHAPHPGFEGRATLEVIEEMPNFSSDEWLEKTMKYAIGWGLSEA
ncbi:hypothetical protein [Cohnella soli]|uniref:Peptidase S9 prolyl oligopeptidase catalytic domain-containing protein n=1 Tax=Cohnella soli TaxID=425005 RepID=A0ABW0HUT6_9BACL